MAITGPTKTLTVTTQTRSRIIQINAPYGGAPSITAHRELVRSGSDGKVDYANAAEVTRKIEDVIKESYNCADGTVIEVRHMVEAIPAIIDRWETEDNSIV